MIKKFIYWKWFSCFNWRRKNRKRN